MDDALHSGAISASNSEPETEVLEEISEPIHEEGESAAQPLAPGMILAPEDEERFTVVRLLRDSFPLRLYEARQDEDEDTLWLWERVGPSASLLSTEAALLREVVCPVFPRVQASFPLAERSYLATERCDGATFGELLSARKLDASRAVSVLSQLAFGLTKLHAAGFVHLGLRPSVVVPGRPTKILDFSDATRVGQTCSRKFYHAGYTAPELLREDPADVRSDIYSVGALLFHAVEGKPVAESGAELLAWEPETPVAGVPQILSRCLGGKESRYSSAAELHRDLLRLARRLAPAVRYAIGSATSIGLEPTRTTNQDAFTYCLGATVSEGETQSWLMACVADGMGGMEAGEAASEAVVRTMEAKAHAAFSTRSVLLLDAQASQLMDWVQEANEQVIASLEKHKARGGSTLVCACLVGNRLAIAHVGDSRLYLIRGGEARPLTVDHSLAMALVAQGELKLADLRTRPERSQVTRSLGERRPMPAYFVDTLLQVVGKSTMELEAGDTLLLCSDGVWEPLSEEEIVSFVAAGGSDLNAVAEAMVNETLTRGGGDNATAVLVRLT
jgi:protein phosphatase